MSEMPAAGEGHGHATLVGGSDDFVVPLGAARLYGRGSAGLGGGDETIGKREKCIAANGAAVEIKPGLTSLPNRDAASIDAAHLAGTDTECTILGGINDGVGLNVLDGAPAEKHGLKFVLAWVALGDNFEIDGRGLPKVAFLHEERLGADGADVPRHDVGRVEQQLDEAQVFLFLEQLECVGGEVWRDDDLGENLADRLGGDEVLGAGRGHLKRRRGAGLARRQFRAERQTGRLGSATE